MLRQDQVPICLRYHDERCDAVDTIWGVARGGPRVAPRASRASRCDVLHVCSCADMRSKLSK